MRSINVTNNVTLDGVMQGPVSPTEDTRGGFTRGGWAMPYNDAVKAKAMGEGMAKGSDMLFGRRSYEHFFKAWHGRTDGNPFTPVLDKAHKYVVSNTLKEPLPWENSTLLSGDAADAVAKLKATAGKDLVILGSGELIKALVARGLIDSFVLVIHPLVLGSGRRLFADDGSFAKFKLVKSLPTPSGLIIATYDLDRTT
jgi:dihydrofolate reductase